MTRKDWFDVKAPSFFEVRNVGKTFANRSQGLSEYFWSVCMRKQVLISIR